MHFLWTVVNKISSARKFDSPNIIIEKCIVKLPGTPSIVSIFDIFIRPFKESREILSFISYFIDDLRGSYAGTKSREKWHECTADIKKQQSDVFPIEVVRQFPNIP